jgi:hypothetical protein
MADQIDRIESSYTDVLAVERHAPGMVRVVTHSDAYVVDARHETCECPDFEYHLDGQGRCKHLYAALRETDQLNTPVLLGLDDDLDTPSDPVACDGGERPDDCNCPPRPSAGIELPCFECYLAGFDTVNTETES